MIGHSRIMLLYSGIVFASSFVNQTPHQPSINQNRFHSGSFFVSVSYETQNVPFQPIIPSLVCMHYPLCKFSGFLTQQCSSYHIHFHCYHSPSPDLLLVSENKPHSVIAVLVGFFRKSPINPSHSSFILCGVVITVIIISINRYSQ